MKKINEQYINSKKDKIINKLQIMSNLFPSIKEYNMNELEEGEISNDNISSPKKNKNVINAKLFFQKNF